MPSAMASTMNMPLVGQSFWPRCLAPASGRARLSFMERGTFALHAQMAVPSSALAIEHAGPVAPCELFTHSLQSSIMCWRKRRGGDIV
jgi:hypothetical protein